MSSLYFSRHYYTNLHHNSITVEHDILDPATPLRKTELDYVHTVSFSLAFYIVLRPQGII